MSIQTKPFCQFMILVRGIPGSGTYEIASHIRDTYPFEYQNFGASKRRHYFGIETFSNQAFFYNSGTYSYDRMLADAARMDCYFNAEASLRTRNSVVVDNYFIRVLHMQNYLDMAERMGIKRVVIRATGESPNEHAIPQEVVDSMRENMEDYNGEILIDPTDVKAMREAVQNIFETKLFIK